MTTSERKLPKIAIVVVNHFSPFHLSVPSMVFGNDFHDQPMFDTTLVAGEPGSITSEIGMTITPQAGLDALQHVDVIVLPYWRDHQEHPNQPLLDALIDAHRRGITIMGLCLGGYILGYSGMLDGRAAAMHWEFETDFSQRFPTIKLDTNALYVEDGNLITSAGIAANIDCCLYVYRKLYGSKAANKIARRMVVPPHRDGGQAQYIERPVPKVGADGRISVLLDQMRQQLSHSYQLDELASSVLMTRRTFTRKFQSATGMSVGQWLTTERLHQAQELLESSDLSIEQIADSVGFSSVIVFRAQFKKQFQVTPKEWRRTFQG